MKLEIIKGGTQCIRWYEVHYNGQQIEQFRTIEEALKYVKQLLNQN